jgi:hypothetical protein
MSKPGFLVVLEGLIVAQMIKSFAITLFCWFSFDDLFLFYFFTGNPLYLNPTFFQIIRVKRIQILGSSTMTLSIITLSITTLSTITLSIKTLGITFKR